jgi:hypothetical protein
MGKILLFVSFVITLLSAGIGFMNKGKLADVSAQAEQAESQLKAKSSELAAKSKALDEANKNLATATAEKEQVTAQIASVKADADAAKAQVADLTTRATAAEAKVTTAEADVASAKKELEDFKANNVASTTPTSSPEDKAIIEELKTVNTKLSGELDAAKSQLEVAQKEKTDRIALKMRDGLEGRILAVNPAWNFVVLNLGEKQGVANNAELLVKRGRQLVGKVRITSVEPSSSIADIVVNSVPSGTVISPGDNVIFQAVEE